MILPTVVSSLLVFAFALFPINDYDIWFHLAGGELMLQGAFPYFDTFSYSSPGAAWYPNSWSFDVLATLANNLIGLDGLNILKAIVVTVLFLLIISHVKRKNALNLLSLSFIVIAFFALRGDLTLRPNTFAYLFLVTFLLLLDRYKESRESKWIIALALTQLLWVNMHASFIFGLALAGIVLVSDTILQKKNDRANIFLVASVFVASLLHVIYGPTFFLRLVTEFLTPSTHTPIREAMPLTPGFFLSLKGVVIIFAWCLIIIGSIRKKHLDVLLSTLFFSLMAVLLVRFTRDLLVYLVMITPLYFSVCKECWKQYARINLQLKEFPVRTFSTYSFYVLLFALFLFAKSSTLGVGVGIDQYRFPINAVDFIKKENLLEKSGGNLYNTYNFGGYLLFRGEKVFIDGRERPYYEQGIFDRYWQNFEDENVWKDSVKKYTITAALMTLPHIVNGKIYNDSSRMFPKDTWALIYTDDVSALYAKRGVGLDDVIAEHEYHMLNPQALDLVYLQEYVLGQGAFEEVFAELQRALSIHPESYKLHFTLSYVYSLVGRNRDMREELKRAIEINPHFDTARDILMKLR